MIWELGCLCSQELDLLAGNAARLMLCHNFEKPGMPVPRAKVTEAILAEYKQEPAALQRRITTVRWLAARCFTVSQPVGLGSSGCYNDSAPAERA